MKSFLLDPDTFNRQLADVIYDQEDTGSQRIYLTQVHCNRNYFITVVLYDSEELLVQRLNNIISSSTSLPSIQVCGLIDSTKCSIRLTSFEILTSGISTSDSDTSETVVIVVALSLCVVLAVLGVFFSTKELCFRYCYWFREVALREKLSTPDYFENFTFVDAFRHTDVEMTELDSGFDNPAYASLPAMAEVHSDSDVIHVDETSLPAQQGEVTPHTGMPGVPPPYGIAIGLLGHKKLADDHENGYSIPTRMLRYVQFQDGGPITEESNGGGVDNLGFTGHYEYEPLREYLI